MVKDIKRFAPSEVVLISGLCGKPSINGAQLGICFIRLSR